MVGAVGSSGPAPAPASSGPAVSGQTRSLTDRTVDWPGWEQWARAILMQDYNTRVVVAGTTLLGLAAGLVGSFTLLRRRALLGDALSHATLPGIGLAYVLVTALGGNGKSLPVLLLGAAVSGLVGMGAILLIRNTSRLKEDAALGIVLSVFFGIGVAILGVAQQTGGHAAGLEGFIYGKAASLRAGDAWLIGGVSLGCLLLSAAYFKELKLVCFDEAFAGSRGYPVFWLDVLLMGLVVLVTIIGLQSVGLILMIALLVIPPAAARFWTADMMKMAWLSALSGAVCCLVGASLSAVFPRLPSGAVIVLVAAVMFLTSMFAGSQRGILARRVRRIRLERSIDREHLLRGLYEILESRTTDGPPGPQEAVLERSLLEVRSWSAKRLKQVIRRCEREGLVVERGGREVVMTRSGFREAARLVHQHRLWELYLLEYADTAAARVDRQADTIEHAIEPEIVAELERLLAQRQNVEGVPLSPHPVGLDVMDRPDDFRRGGEAS